MSTETAVVPLEGYGFCLTSGEYALRLEEGRLRVARQGATEGVAFATLGEEGWNALPFIRQRRIEQVEGRPRVTLLAGHDGAAFSLTFDADPARPGLFHWRFAVTPRKRSTGVPPFPEMAFTTPPRITLYTQQAPMAAGLVYLYEETVLDSTLFYFQDLTALNGYFAATRTGPTGDLFPTPLLHLPPGIVGCREDRLGLALPGAEGATLPAGATTVVSEGYLALTPGRPEDEPEMARRFLEDLTAPPACGWPAATTASISYRTPNRRCCPPRRSRSAPSRTSAWRTRASPRSTGRTTSPTWPTPTTAASPSWPAPTTFDTTSGLP